MNKAVELLAKIEEYKKLIENVNVLAIFLHGSFARNPEKKEMTNDIDLLIVTDKLEFSTFVTEKLIGFEHIRHTENGLDLCITDEEHCLLAMTILRVLPEFLLFKRRELNLSSEVVEFSKEMAKVWRDKDEEGWLNRGKNEKAFEKLFAWGTENLKDFDFYLGRIVPWWLRSAEDSWYNRFVKKG